MKINVICFFFTYFSCLSEQKFSFEIIPARKVQVREC